MNVEKKVSWRVAMISGVVVFLIGIFVGVVAIYARYGSSESAQNIASFLHLPVLVVWEPFDIVTANELSGDMRSLRQFYENQDFASVGMRVDFTTSDGQKRLLVRERGILNKAVEDAVVEGLARENGIRVTATEVDQNVERKLHEFGTEDRVIDDLHRLYGWDLQDFKRKVVKPQIYRERLASVFAEREDSITNTRAFEKIRVAQEALNGGRTFEEVAKEYSEGSTASSGGDLGKIDLSQAEPSLAQTLETIEVGQVSDIIETPLGYHIVRLDGVFEEGDKTLYQVHHIIARKELFADWVNQEIQKASVWVMLPAYEWSAETGFVEFADEAMKDFEEKNVQPEKGVFVNE